MRLRTLLTTFIMIMLLMNVTAIAFNISPSAEGKTYKPESNHPQTAQSTGGDYASYSAESRGASQSNGAEIQNHRVEKQGSDIFSLESFVKDLSSQRTDRWSSFAYVDNDSAELVVGVDNAYPDGYTKINDFIVENGGKLVNAISIRAEVVALVADMPLNAVSVFVTQVQASNVARYVEPNMKFQTQFVPNDPYWSLQWGPQKIEADYAWDTTIGNSTVLVAVIDTGLDYKHPDLKANYVKGGYDWVNRDNDPLDDHGHGTHCAGIVAAQLNNSIGIAGVAQVGIMAEKGLDAGGWGTEDNLASAIIHAVDQGADILSNSWGGPDSTLIHDAIKYAYSEGALTVAAAGNGASSAKLYPAAYEEVVAVTATDRFDNPASFTNFGDWVEFAAPGVDIYSTISSIHDPRFTYPYDFLSGTSMSTPHVSGTAALVWSQFPNVSRDWVFAQLMLTGDDLGDPGFDEYYGYGRINARKSVEQAPANHDLLISSWQRPNFVEPRNLVNFNVTVLNFGKNDESNLMVDLLVDGNITNSKSISFLASGYSDTVSLLWNASFEGKYNVTVWVEPVAGEDKTTNNAMSLNINVQFIEIALFKNVDPWRSTANEEVLSKYGISYAVFGSKDFGQINLTSFSKVIIASDQDQTFYIDMDAHRSWFEDYVNKGGLLEIHAADWGWNGGEWVGTLPGGLQWSHFSSDFVTIVDRVHPVVTRPNPITDAELDNWHSSVHGYFSIYPPSSRIVLKEDYTGSPAYLEFYYGAGVIVASSQTLEFAYMNRYSLILENSLLYTVMKYPHEIGVLLEAPTLFEPGYSALLNATLYNIGLNTENNVTLQLLIDGSIVSSVGIPELKNGSSYTLDYLWVSPKKGTYNITAYAPPVPDEQFMFNNKMTRFVEVRYPLIRPVVGQWANYAIDYYDNMGRKISAGYWNFTYGHYVGPYLIYITSWLKDPSGYNSTGWMIVNTMNRWVESGIWAGMWYPGWVETNITIGSTINLLTDQTTVNGSRIIPVGIYPIDCWEIPLGAYEYQYTFWYDKVSGLWIGMDFTTYPYYRYELRLVDTNIPIGTSYEHELATTLEASSILEPGDSLLLNVTAHNIGLNTESNVKMSLLIDGAEAKSAIIPALSNGTSYTLSYLWTPTVESRYNVTAYVQPVSGEVIAVNNAATKIVNVRKTKGYVLFDQTHGTDPVYAYSTWVSNLTDRGYVVDTLVTGPITPSMLKGYNVFVIPQARSYYSANELLAIQDFVVNGGGLLVIGDDNPYICTTLTEFIGITWDGTSGYPGPTKDITPHPVTQGVNTAFFSSPWSRLSVKLLAQDVIRDAWRNIMLAVAEFGKGRVIGLADEDSVNDLYIHNSDNLRLANNMIDWLKTRRPIASFTYSPLDPYVGEIVTFDASASYDPDGTIVSYSWDFGDGALGSGAVATHVYGAGGNLTVTLTVTDNEGLYSEVTAEIKIQRTSLDVQLTTGSIHLKGEIVEIYVVVSSLGKPIDANIKATLYHNGKAYESLNAFIERIGLGFYRISYTIPLNAPIGTYALIVEASYFTLRGIALGDFLLSPTLTSWNPILVGIDETVATIQTDLGLIKVKLEYLNPTLLSIKENTAIVNSTFGTIKADVAFINARLVALDDNLATVQTDIGTISTDIANIQLKVTEIVVDVATIQTAFGTYNGFITSIHDDMATIETDIGTVKTRLDGWTGGTISQIIKPSGTFQILVFTNSTVEDPIAFSDNMLTISLSGSSGTNAMVNVIIPKPIIVNMQSSIYRIVVTIDDKRINFVSKEEPEAYVLSIICAHSAHTIKIYLAGLRPTPSAWSLYIIAASIVVLAAVVSVATYFLKIQKPRSAKQK